MNEQERRKVRLELRDAADKFLDAIKKEINNCVIFCDVGRLERLTRVVDEHMAYEVIKIIRDKGFAKELAELCDKVGRVGS